MPQVEQLQRIARRLRRFRKPGPKPKARPRGADGKREPRTIAEGWEAYARKRKRRGRSGVGKVWNRPRKIGLEAGAKELVPLLDREVFTPHFGTVDVIVEIGPGGGRFTEVLLPKCRLLHGVDTSPTMLELLHERFGDDERIVYHESEGRGLDMLGDESVDAAFSYGVFVHLQHWDIYNYLAEVHRVLKPGAKAIIQHSNSFSELGWEKFVADVPRQLNKHKHPKTFVFNTPEIMDEFARRAGLETVEMITHLNQRDCIAVFRKPVSPSA